MQNQRLIIDPEFEVLLPPATPERYAELVESIRTEGQRDPIVVWAETGIVLDGHHRLRACRELKRTPWTMTISLPDRASALAWIVANQASRRNLSDDHTAALCTIAGVPIPASVPAGARIYARQILEIAGGREALQWMLEEPTRTLRMARNRVTPRKPRAPRGPSTKPAIPEGHELSGVSTLTGPDGTVTAEWNKTRIHGADEPPVPVPEDHLIRKTSRMLRGDGTTAVEWISTAADEVRREELMRAAWARHAEIYQGLAGTATAPAHADDEICTVYPIGDPHIGMLAWAPEAGEDFDSRIATRDLVRTTRMLAGASPPSGLAIVVNLGDFLHAQDDQARTPGHGNVLDVDSRYAKVLDAGHACLRAIVDAALERHGRVIVRNLPGNHDPRVAAELCFWLRAVYANEPRVEIADAFAAHQYDRFGRVLLGWHHGDRAKIAELPAIMATDRAEDWGLTEHRYIHTGHVHHLQAKEVPGCVIESHRTLAAKDAWHAGRYRSGRSLCAITYHRDFGEIARQTVGIRRARA